MLIIRYSFICKTYSFLVASDPICAAILYADAEFVRLCDRHLVAMVNVENVALFEVVNDL